MNQLFSYSYRPLRWLFLGSLLVISACSRDIDLPQPDTLAVSAYSAEVPLAWNTLYLDLERFTPGYRPPISARTIGYVGLAAYESVQAGMSDKYNSLGNYFPGLELPYLEEDQTYHWPTVLTATYERMLELMFPGAPSEHLFRIIQLRNEFYIRFKQEIPSDVFGRSVRYGTEMADAVHDWSASDELGHEAYDRNVDLAYSPPTGQGLWQPTFPDYTPGLVPYWGQIRTFVAGPDDIVDPPLEYSEDPASALYLEAIEVLEASERAKVDLASEERWIADFWSDDCPILTSTPAGRWIGILNQVIESENKPLDKALEAYARVGMALADAGIRCWHEKYRYNHERPIDYIRRVMGDNSWNTVMCPDGSGQFFTPNFPAYPSGHAAFGAAAAAVMSDLFGNDYAMVDNFHAERTEFNGTPRSFTNFREMARENAESRIPLGVHFRMDSDAGLDLGFSIGEKVNAMPWRR
ncbi:vanadium-dependent haloperoxidase [Flavilitoribacter nigricans]|uniref:Uncharacterized protein n=1 Tax=Flavilitoribacter nigricans (strain ATCC 23147 / DSM 23189 / NBRC 102662 / NCIMB 1420 / SS-2) TaxID=1122177 RepID=A0A2D0N478_FLAN2|nr:vanadium-dependent haloperoxidase [Flavilitoribacter nigricans]PHN03295.1 hypothetical protein CRP01_28290 [Flavilitoribacter nigricans DSM 23189 = NBRC 102662]